MELKPCFCGSTPVYKTARRTCGHGEFPLFGWVECDCGLRIRERIVDGFYGSTDSKDSVIELWNVLVSLKGLPLPFEDKK